MAVAAVIILLFTCIFWSHDFALVNYSNAKRTQNNKELKKTKNIITIFLTYISSNSNNLKKKRT
jgi:uncharacterized membrane protein